MIKCEQCGYPNPDGRLECFKCASQLRQPVAAMQQVPQPQPTQQVSNAPEPTIIGDARFCMQCGVPLPVGSAFCPGCGRNIHGGPAHDQSPNAMASIILSVIGLFAWLIPIIGLPVSTIGLLLGLRAINGTKKGTAWAGIVMSILGLILSILWTILSAEILAPRFYRYR